MIQLQKRPKLLKDLLKQRSNSPPSPSKTAADHIIKGAYLLMLNAALLAQENASLAKRMRRNARNAIAQITRYLMKVALQQQGAAS